MTHWPRARTLVALALAAAAVVSAPLGRRVQAPTAPTAATTSTTFPGVDAEVAIRQLHEGITALLAQPGVRMSFQTVNAGSGHSSGSVQVSFGSHSFALDEYEPGVVRQVIVVDDRRYSRTVHTDAERDTVPFTVESETDAAGAVAATLTVGGRLALSLRDLDTIISAARPNASRLPGDNKYRLELRAEVLAPLFAAHAVAPPGADKVTGPVTIDFKLTNGVLDQLSLTGMAITPAEVWPDAQILVGYVASRTVAIEPPPLIGG
jgi:hypothetical protein